MASAAFIDIQGFKISGDKFILKEISCITDQIEYHAIVESPFSFGNLNKKFQLQAKWLTKFYHGICWLNGNFKISQVKDHLRELLQDQPNFVKGLEKANWLRQLFPEIHFEVYDLDTEHGCDLKLSSFNSDKKREEQCSFHMDCEKQFQCARVNALAIKKWYNDNIFVTKLE